MQSGVSCEGETVSHEDFVDVQVQVGFKFAKLINRKLLSLKIDGKRNN